MTNLTVLILFIEELVSPSWEILVFLCAQMSEIEL